MPNTNRKAELKIAFALAKSMDETLKLFKEMESCFEESELGIQCYMVTDKLLKETHKDFQLALSFGKRAYRIFAHSNSNVPSLFITSICFMLGSVCLTLEKYDESLRYLNRANENLSLEECSNTPIGVLHNLLGVQQKLCIVKKALGKREDVVVHAKKVLEIKEKVMEEGSVEIAEANRDVYESLFEVVDLEGALPFCLKALEIYKKCLGDESLEVAQATRHLAIIYYKSGEYEKAFEQNQLSQNLFKKLAPNSPDSLKAEADGALTLIGLGRYEEAVDILKGVISRTDIEEKEQASVYMTMARALCYLEKFADAKKYMRAARGILEKKDMDPLLVSIAFMDMSMMYDKMDDFETSVSLIKRILALSVFPQKILLELSVRLLSLISLCSKEKEDIPYMEGVMKKIKLSFGPEHCQVGYCYTNLAVAYSRSGQDELAAKSWENAKHVLDASLGPHHLNALKASHGLSVSYAELGRYRNALEIEEKVIEGLKGLEASELGFLHEVVKLLGEMKERVAESPTTVSTQSKDDGGLSTEISKCGLSDDGHVLK